MKHHPFKEPVSPLLCTICEGQESLFGDDGEAEVDLQQALFKEPIVGVEKVLLDEQGPGALPPVLSHHLAL